MKKKVENLNGKIKKEKLEKESLEKETPSVAQLERDALENKKPEIEKSGKDRFKKNKNKLEKQIEKLNKRIIAYSFFAKVFSYPEPSLFNLVPPMLNHILSLTPNLADLKTQAHSLTDLEAQYVTLLLCKENGSMTASPLHESSYARDGRMLAAQELADIAGFYLAFGLQVKEEADKPDHISTELEFMSFLTLKEKLAIENINKNINNVNCKYEMEKYIEGKNVCRRAQKLFLKDHLGCWISVFKEKLLKLLPAASFYCQSAAILETMVQQDMKHLSIKPSGLASFNEKISEDNKISESEKEPVVCPYSLQKS